MQGFKFICDILSIISSDRDKREKYRKYRDSGERFDNRMKEVLVTDWTSLARKVLHDNAELKEELINYYQRISLDKINLRTEDMQKYEQDVIEQFNNSGERKTLSNTFNNIVVNQKGTRPYFLFGFSATIVIAVGNYSDFNFYIGIEEAKDLLFRAMEVLGYINVECIPDSCFYEDTNLRYLLLAALYHSLLVMLPYHENHRDNNYNTGRNIVEKVIKSDTDSKLFKAIKRATEADAIIRILWEAQDELCKVDEIFKSRELPLEDFFSVPSLRGNVKKYKLLSCDIHYRVKSFVVGKEGSGKSCLAKAITLACRHKFTNLLLENSISNEIGLGGKTFIPVLLDCNQLDVGEIKSEGIINCALNQMYLNAQQIGNKKTHDTLRHFRECKENIIQYCVRKAYAEELLLLVDGVSKIEKDCLQLLIKNLDDLCASFPNLHIVLFSTRLKQSEMRMLPRYNFFYIDDFKYIPESLAIVCDNIQVNRMEVERSIKADRLLRQFVDTPRRFFRYLESNEKKDFLSLISACIDEEIDNKCGHEVPKHMCKDFLICLAIEALNKRKSITELIIPEKLIDGDFFSKISNKIDNPIEIWTLIQRKSVLLERSKYINSFQFSNPLYFYCIMSDYYIDVMEKCGEKECSGILLDGFSKLSATEFSIIITMIFNRLAYGKDSLLCVNVSEENLEIFFKAITGILFSYIYESDVENCLWALNKILNDGDWTKEFLIHGKYENRTLMLKQLERLYKAIILVNDI